MRSLVVDYKTSFFAKMALRIIEKNPCVQYNFEKYLTYSDVKSLSIMKWQYLRFLILIMSVHVIVLPG